MRILGIERDELATNHYRILQPLYKLREHSLAEILTLKDYELGFKSSPDKVLMADMVVIYSPSSEQWLDFVKTLRRNGKIVVADFDDNPFNTSPLNPAYRYFGTEEVAYKWPDGTVDMLWSQDMTGSDGSADFFNIERNIKHRDLFKIAFKKSDLVTTTNETLASEFRKLNPNVSILPNLIDFSMYPKVDCVKKEVRIGWQGGSSHYEDICMIVEPLKKILNKYDNVKFVYWGDWRFQNLFKDFPQDKIEFQSWVKHSTYPYKLACINLDIGLCPVVDSVFNRCKSAIKYFEYSVMGAATIASNIPPYSEVITEKEGILVSEDKWFDAIEELILNKENRLTLAKNAYENVYMNHNADTKAHLWLDAYEKILKKELVSI